MARFALHKTFPSPKQSEVIAAADRLSACIRVWEDDPEAAFDYVVLNTETESIVWRPESVASFPAARREGERVRAGAVVAVLLIRAEPGEDGLDAARRVVDQAQFATDDLLASTVRSAVEVDDNA